MTDAEKLLEIRAIAAKAVDTDLFENAIIQILEIFIAEDEKKRS